MRNFFFLIFLLGPGFGASNKKEIKKLKKKVQLMEDMVDSRFLIMEHIIGKIYTRLHCLSIRIEPLCWKPPRMDVTQLI